MKLSVAAMVIATAVILATDLGAQESVCDLFSHLEKYDGHQLTLSGDLIISNAIAVLGAADCEYRYSSEGFTYPAALRLNPSPALTPAQMELFQKAAADADRLRTRGKTIGASGTFSGRLRIAPAGEFPAEFMFDSFENLKIEALPDAASLDVIPVCTLFQNLPNWLGKRVAVRGEFVRTTEGAWIVGHCQGGFVTDGYRWPVSIWYGSPAYYSRETAKLYAVKPPLISKGEDLKGTSEVVKTATFVGTLRVSLPYNVVCTPEGRYRAYGYGHLNAAAAELIVESIRDLELTPRPDAPIDSRQVNPEQHCVPPSRAELCAKADTLARAAQRDCPDKVRQLLVANGIDSKNGSESEALITAIRAGNKDIVEILLEAGAPVNPSQTALWPPLSDAAFSKHFDIMKLLLQSGARVDALDHHGDTLLVSTGFFDPGVTMILLEAGANPNASDREGQTPLMKASARGFQQAVKILLDHHADVNQKDVKGRTALMHAAASYFSDAIPVLLENGADPNARDKEGKSALDLADKSNNLGALAMLSLAVKRSH
jgi:ankyrin repeat protein